MVLCTRSSVICLVILSLITFGNVEVLRAQSANVEALKAQVRQRNQRNWEAKQQAQKKQAEAEAAAAAKLKREQATAAVATAIAAAKLEREKVAAEAAKVAKDYDRMLKISQMNRDEYESFIETENIESWVTQNGSPNLKNLSVEKLTLSDIINTPWIKASVVPWISNFDNIMSHLDNDYKNSKKLSDITGLPELLNNIQSNLNFTRSKLEKRFIEKRNYVSGSIEPILENSIIKDQKKNTTSQTKQLDVKIMCNDYTVVDYSGSPPYCSANGGYQRLISGEELKKWNQIAGDFLLGSENSYEDKTKFPDAAIENTKWEIGPKTKDFSDAYPDAAQWAGVNGTTTVMCIVSTSGHLEDCTVLDESPSNFEFGKSAIKVSGRWKMAPLVVDGTPVTARWKARIRWSIVGPITNR